MLWFVAAAALGLAGRALWTFAPAGSRSADAVAFSDVTLPRDISPVTQLNSGFGLSPDGRRIFMIGVRGGLRRLFLRDLGALAETELVEFTGVNGAAFSPDGTRLALNSGAGVISTISLSDREQVTRDSNADVSGGLDWGEAGIVFTRNGALVLAPTDGSPPRPLTTLDGARREVLHETPMSLPGGRVVLFSSLTSDPASTASRRCRWPTPRAPSSSIARRPRSGRRRVTCCSRAPAR